MKATEVTMTIQVKFVPPTDKWFPEEIDPSHFYAIKIQKIDKVEEIEVD